MGRTGLTTAPLCRGSSTVAAMATCRPVFTATAHEDTQVISDSLHSLIASYEMRAIVAAVMSHSGIAYSPSQSRSALDESVTDDAARGLHSDSMRTVDGFTPRMGPAGHPGSLPFFEPLLLPDGSGGPAMRHSHRQAYAASMMRGGGYAAHPNLSLNAAVNAPAGYDHSATGGDYLAFSSALGGGVGSDSSAQLSPPADAFAASLSSVRWWVLFVFCLISFNQSLIWVTYSPITRKTCDYYKISEAQVDLLLNWGPITNLPLLALTAKIASSTRGLRRLIMATACVELIACVLRLIPEVIAHSTLHPHSLYFLHTAQILNAAAGPSVQVTVTKLSAVWFPSGERTTSTALLFVANSLGAAAGFLLGPALVDTPGDMSRFLWLQLGLAGLGFLCAFPVLPRFYFPEKPRYFPSKAAAQMSDESAGLVRTGPDGTPLVMPGFLASVRLACGNRSFVLLVLSSGLLQGVFGCWGSVLSTVIPWLSESTCGWLSFCMSMTGVTAGVLVGPLTGHPYLRRKTKAVMLALIAGSVACGTAFMLLTPSIFDKDPVIPSQLHERHTADESCARACSLLCSAPPTNSM